MWLEPGFSSPRGSSPGAFRSVLSRGSRGDAEPCEAQWEESGMQACPEERPGTPGCPWGEACTCTLLGAELSPPS